MVMKTHEIEKSNAKILSGAGLLVCFCLNKGMNWWWHPLFCEEIDVIMSAMASQITGVSTVCSTLCSGVDKKHESSASPAFVRGIHRWPVDTPLKWWVTRKMFPFYHASWQAATHPSLAPMVEQLLECDHGGVIVSPIFVWMKLFQHAHLLFGEKDWWWNCQPYRWDVYLLEFTSTVVGNIDRCMILMTEGIWGHDELFFPGLKCPTLQNNVVNV